MSKKLVLAILDGWGETVGTPYNAIHLARTPYWDYLKSIGTLTYLEASGPAVGLPEGQMGNSEVGHMHIGAGRIVPQDLTRINTAIQTNTWAKNPHLRSLFSSLKKNKNRLHLIGLYSAGGVHAHKNHWLYLIQYIKQELKELSCYLHLFLDGRDTLPRQATTDLKELNEHIANTHIQIASITGRYYAMDRDQRWERIQCCYDLLTGTSTSYYEADAIEALHAAYDRGETDEFLRPTRLKNFQPLLDHDVVLFMNFRSDRARALSKALIQKNFDGFDRKKLPQLKCYILTRYQEDLKASVLFESDTITDTLGEVIEKQSLSKLRIAETEKYAHVTFFLNGGRDTPFKNEIRRLIPSPKISTYDLQPSMRAHDITNTACVALQTESFALTVLNYANADMVGHTGKLPAAIQAVESIDVCLKQLHQMTSSVGADLCITADHGNIEQLFYENSQQAHTAHTTHPVPFLYVGKKKVSVNLSITQTPSLIDVAPTVLALMHLPIPDIMTG